MCVFWCNTGPRLKRRRTARFRPASDLHLYGKDRGCTRPGCDVRGYWCEVHHVEHWATTHCTDINTLTLACGSDHPLVQPGGWTTRKNARGDTEWDPAIGRR